MSQSAALNEVSLFGASPDTGNRGVTALCHAVIWHLFERQVARTNLFDHGRGERLVQIPFGPQTLPVYQIGGILSRRYYRSENLWNIRVSNWLGGLGNPAAKAVRRSQLVLDVSAGDSFTDLYGPKRFQTIMFHKWIVREAGRPLILLPQTYGPFQQPASFQAARDVLNYARQAWARDADSFAALRELAGDSFDPARHRQGVDLAFALPPFPPAHVPPELAAWLAPAERPQETLVGFNISGLIFNQPEPAKRQFKLQADYPALVREFLEWILKTTELRIVLVAHVIAPEGNVESDLDAARAFHASLPEHWRARVQITPPDWSPSELKWLIGQTTWFCGTRMHSTIGALGTETPAAAVSYSLKTRGVFATCGQAHAVFELRHSSTADIVDALKNSFQSRDATRRALAQDVPAVRLRAKSQLDEMLATVQSATS
ncbi:MAG: polysaccharide pyruvyl transferase family protein [Planctomycetota bacterium]|nr:polysaccharide pyruvyl transferase family protein [Planctomycetota bacterium]